MLCHSLVAKAIAWARTHIGNAGFAVIGIVSIERVLCSFQVNQFELKCSVTLAHTAGTCQMGPDSDPLAVVDPLLRVRGIKNLRVADSSIMPFVPSGNTNAAAVIINPY